MVEVSPSLVASIIGGLDAIESYPYNFTEGIVSRMLPNLGTYKLIKELNIDTPQLKSDLEDRN